MMKKEDDFYNDDFLKKLIKDGKLEEPSDQFTNKVMDRVMQEWLTRPIPSKKRLSLKGWLGIVFSVVVVLLVVLVTDVRTIIQSLDNPYLERFDNSYLQPIHDAFAQLFNSLVALPVIVYIILIALILLSLLDRIMGKVLQYR